MAISKAQQDFYSYFDNPANIGKAVPFANGTLTLDRNGQASYTDANGRSVTKFNRNTPLSGIAIGNKDIRDAWTQQYGANHFDWGANAPGALYGKDYYENYVAPIEAARRTGTAAPATTQAQAIQQWAPEFAAPTVTPTTPAPVSPAPPVVDANGGEQVMNKPNYGSLPTPNPGELSYTGGSQYFDETTGQYRPGSPVTPKPNYGTALPTTIDYNALATALLKPLQAQLSSGGMSQPMPAYNQGGSYYGPRDPNAPPPSPNRYAPNVGQYAASGSVTMPTPANALLNQSMAYQSPNLAGDLINTAQTSRDRYGDMLQGYAARGIRNPFRMA